MLDHLLPSPCLICHETTLTSCCVPCLADLPWVPHHCTHCRRAVPSPSACCSSCLINPSPYHYIVPLLYQPPIRQIITAFKLGEQEYLCASLASIFISRLTGLKPDVLIPVPSHPKRLWARGYNPALLIAYQIGKRLGIPVNDRAVRRVRHTAPQRLQKKEARETQLCGAFETVGLIHGLRVALVDDVVTTGATLRSMAQAIAPHASHIEYWAIAESPHLTLKSGKPSRETTRHE